MNKKIDKKGTDKILSMYWFIILVLVAGGVFAMVYSFYSAPYDVRETESKILAEKIADCISKNGVINSEFINGGVFNTEINKTFSNNCSFNFAVEEGYGDNKVTQYFYEVDFYTPKDAENSAFSFDGGNSNWKVDCFIKKESDKDYTKLAKCTEKRFYALGGNGEQYLIKILSVIGKSEKNVKQ